MSLRQRILNIVRNTQGNITMKQLYTQFPDIAKTTIRGRVYDNLGKGITRIGTGLYISSEAIVEHGDTLQIVDRMIDQGDFFDFIFLDIPYSAAGQKGGNRNLFACDTISVDEFGVLINKFESLLKTDSSPLIFMFTSGKTSMRAHDNYMKQFNKSSLKLCKIGSYTKLWSTGNRMNMGKYLMPPEHIYVFNKSGVIDNWVLDFQEVPDVREYPSSKPYPMIKKLVEQTTKIGDWVLDPFGGSGKVLKACLELKRMCHIIDNSPVAINNHILPLL
jgi:DNA modification methylase